MCVFTPPQVPFLANPTQAPLSWLLLGGAVLFLVAMDVVGVPRYFRTTMPIPGRTAALGLLAAGQLVAVANLALFAVVIMPSRDVLQNWYQRVFATTIQHCGSTAVSGAFFHTDAQLQLTLIHLIWLGLVLLVVTWMLGLLWHWFRQKYAGAAHIVTTVQA